VQINKKKKGEEIKREAGEKDFKKKEEGTERKK
jgi:hypothetical protein